jgi:hypothetical protein
MSRKMNIGSCTRNLQVKSAQLYSQDSKSQPTIARPISHKHCHSERSGESAFCRLPRTTWRRTPRRFRSPIRLSNEHSLDSHAIVIARFGP